MDRNTVIKLMTGYVKRAQLEDKISKFFDDETGIGITFGSDPLSHIVENILAEIHPDLPMCLYDFSVDGSVTVADLDNNTDVNVTSIEQLYDVLVKEV